MNNEDGFFSNVLYNCYAKHKFLKKVLGMSVVSMHKGEKVSYAPLT